MAEHNDTGKKGEDIAAEYLSGKGYKILERNWYNYHAEIDIIATKDNELIIAEVKCRSGNPVVEPYAAVNRNKQKLLIKATNAYILQKDLDMDVRFDIISIIIGAAVQIEHIEGAFYPMAGR
jgi:putative endonuclease